MKVQQMELKVILCSLIIATFLTLLAIFLNSIGQYKNFYSCWANGLFFHLFNVCLCFAYLLTLYCSVFTIKSLRQVEASIEQNSNLASTKAVLKRFKYVNFAFLSFLTLFALIILLDVYIYHMDNRIICFLTNINIPSLTFIAVFSMYGIHDCKQIVARLGTLFRPQKTKENELNHSLIPEEKESDFTFD